MVILIGRGGIDLLVGSVVSFGGVTTTKLLSLRGSSGGGRWYEVHKHWSCTCGHTAHGDSDDEVVRNAQEHARTAHGKEAKREEILKSAREAKH